MAGQKFQYDESGATFYYFLLSFLALILIPSTFWFWPKKQKEDPRKKTKECQCEHCLVKYSRLQNKEPWKKTKQTLIKFGIIFGWVVFASMAYKVAQFDYEYANFDPYEILQIEVGSSAAEIKKAYRKLSLIYHPDKETGDEKKFMKLTKAYQALTDETAKRNWELYGNPDGPGAMSFGIALPSWIIEKENSVWVLGLYALVFMVALPTVVGIWWYRSIRYSGDQVLLDTTQLYYYFFHKTPNMVLKRVLMILGTSLEFEKGHNSEIQERPSDDIEVPKLIREIGNIGEKNKERPLCFPYSIKARALLHAHLSRLHLPPKTLEQDRMYIVKKCPYLIQEMVTCVSHLIMLAHAGRISHLPSLYSIENCMKLCPMVVQALWENKNPLLQLPYTSEDIVKYFIHNKRSIKSCQQLAEMDADKRRSVMRSLKDEQYEDAVKVLAKMPYLDFQAKFEVIDDEETTEYTAGAIVTVTCTLIRKNMEVLFRESSLKQGQTKQDHVKGQEEEENIEDQTEDNSQQAKKMPVWRKPQKKARKGSQKNAGRKHKVQQVKKEEKKPEEKPTTASEKVHEVKKPEVQDISEGSEEESNVSADEEEPDSQNYDDVKEKSSTVTEDDDEWEKFQSKLARKEKALEGKSKMSHPVHCPFFPDDKQEYWWVYVCDRKQHMLLTAPYQITNLVEQEEVQLKFTAPHKPGIYVFTVYLRSDSYLGFDQCRDMKMDVKKAHEIPTEHPQWDISDDEKEEEGEGSDASEFTTDDEVDEDED